MNKESLFITCNNKYGSESQIQKTREELAELLLVLHHYFQNKVTLPAVIDEIADVSIMLEQLKYCFSVPPETFVMLVNKRIKYKLAYLQKKINDE